MPRFTSLHAVTFVVGLFLLTAGLFSAEKDRPKLIEKDAPATWKLTDINQRLPDGLDPGPMYVLAWEVISDSERCLVFKRLAKVSENGEKTALAYLWRHPKSRTPEWRLQWISPTPGPGFTFHPDIIGYERFIGVPAEHAVADFLKQKMWRAHDEKITDGGVCAKAWKEVFDYSPTVELFPELSDKPIKRERPLVAP